MTVQLAPALSLAVHGLAVWRGDRCLCHDLDFELHGGQALHLQGPNGAGKTSLIRVLTGLGRCDAGEVLWQGEPLRRNSAGYRAALAYLGHNNGVKLGLSPRENLVVAGALMDTPASADIDKALAEVGLSESADLLCGALSMGQRRRTALARLQLSRALLWFLDEPLASLDVAGAALVNRILKTHLAAGGMVVFATHQALELAPFPVLAVKLGTPA